MERLFVGSCFKEDYKILNHAIREFGFNIPPLVNSLHESVADNENVWDSHQ